MHLNNLLCLLVSLPLFAICVPVPNGNELVIRGAITTGSNKGTTSVNGKNISGGKTGHTGSQKVSCVKKKKGTAKNRSRSASKRDQMVIGYTGTDSVQAKLYEEDTKRTENKVARLGTGLYMTDSWSLAEAFSWKITSKDRAKKRTQKVCVIYADATAWDDIPKIWIHNSMANKEGINKEDERRSFEEKHCVAIPSVRFAWYNPGIPTKGNELVIPPDLQSGLTAHCYDVDLKAEDSDVESGSESETATGARYDPPPGIDKLGFKYSEKAEEWGIKGEVERPKKKDRKKEA